MYYFFLSKNIKILLKCRKNSLILIREVDKMTESNTLGLSANRISSFFTSKKKEEKKKNFALKKQKYMRLNFLLLNAFLENSKKTKFTRPKGSLSFFPLFTNRILFSENPHLIKIVKQAYCCCIKQDFYLFPFKQFCLRHELTFHKVIEWRLSRYIKNKEKLNYFVKIMKEVSPDLFRYHLVTLLGKEESREEDKKQINRWDLWKHHNDGNSLQVSKT